MHHAIKMVPLKAQTLIQAESKKVLPPGIVGHFGVGVVRTHLVERQKKKDQAIGNSRQRKCFIASCYQNNKSQSQDVFKQPRFPIDWRYGQKNKFQAQ